MRLPQGKGLLAFFFNRTSQSILAKVKNGRHRFLLQKALPAPRHTTLGYSFVALVSILMTSLPARECKDFCTLTDHLLYSVTHCSSQRLLSSICVKASSSVTALIPSATLSFRFCLILWHTEITLPWCWLRFLLWFIVLSLLGLLAKMQCDYITEFERSGKKIHAVTAQKKTKPFFFFKSKTHQILCFCQRSSKILPSLFQLHHLTHTTEILLLLRTELISMHLSTHTWKVNV